MEIEPMKRITSFILAILMLSSTFAYSEGLLPSLTDAYGVDMPSMAVYLERKPDEETKDETGTVTQVFYQISENDFDGFNNYLEKNGCSLANYSVSGNTVTETIEKQGKTFSFNYDNTSLKAILSFPLGTNPEIYEPAPVMIDATSIGPKQFDGYNFSSSIIQKYDIHYKRPTEMKVGDYVTFGRYEQDNNIENGKEEIVWRILDIQDGKALLFTSTAIEYLQFEDSAETSTWEDCSLRKWLNEDFYNKAFSDVEKESVIETNISNPANPKYGTSSGTETNDRLFLLSSEEFSNYEFLLRRCFENERTPLIAFKQGSEATLYYYWLRTAGAVPKSASIVSSNLLGWKIWMQGVNNSGEDINAYACVSPLVWVDINNDSLRSADDFVILTFGEYEQDNNLDNGKESIEWIVLDQENNKTLLISRFALEMIPYNSSNNPAYQNQVVGSTETPNNISDMDFKWEACQPRTWLNDIFIKDAFTDSEQETISTFYKTNTGKTISDRIFLLSAEEVNRFFSSNDERICLYTSYCKRSYNSLDSACEWCLRSPDDQSNYVSIVDTNGKVWDHYYIYSSIAIRPAMWVTLDE